MRKRRSFSGRRRGWRGKLLFMLFLLLAVLLYIAVRLQPVILQYAENEAQDTLTALISQIVEKQIKDNRAAYEGMVQLSHDNESHVTALQTNILEMDSMKAQVTQRISTGMKPLDHSELQIPLGSILMPAVWGGMGPTLPVGAVSLGTVKAEFVSSFKQAGINQTRHNIVLAVQTQVDLLTVFGSKSVNVDSSFYVTDTVIVGTVPDQYTYIDDTQQGLLGKVRDSKIGQ